MKLFYSQTSPYVRKVMILAHQLGLADQLQLEQVDAFGEAHRQQNPLGKIPALIPEAGDSAIFDSLVICDYLIRKANRPAMLPATGAARDKALRLHAIGQGMCDAAVNLRMQVMRDMKQDQPMPKDWWNDRQHDALRHSVDLLEKESASLDAGLGDLGSISIAAALGYLDFRFDHLQWRDGHPQLAAWFAKASDNAAFRNTAPPA